MSMVPPPRLDARTARDIVTRLRELARVAVPEWQPPPTGDAGTALHRIFARLLEITLERLNRVPERNLLAFLDAFGLSLLPPSPARVPLTFMLTQGSPPSEVPAGTQAASRSTEQRAGVIFETEQTLTVVPAHITAAYTMDPQWDRYANRTLAVSGASETGFTPFVGDWRLPHSLHVTHPALLSFTKQTRIHLTFEFGVGQPWARADVVVFFRALIYEYRTGGELTRIEPIVTSSGAGSTANPFKLDLQFLFDPFEDETIEGGGFRSPPGGHWLHVRLNMPCPDALIPDTLRLRNLTLTLSAADLWPDAAFANDAAVDSTKHFLPFGEIPQRGDALYLASDEAFATPNTTPTITWAAEPISDTGLTPSHVWEYLADTGWQTLTPTGSAGDFKSDGSATFTLPSSPPPLRKALHGHMGYWVRVRLAQSDYGVPVEYEPVNPADTRQGFRVKAGTGNLHAPRLSSLKISYTATSAASVVRQTGFALESVDVIGGFRPFVPVTDAAFGCAREPTPAFYVGFDAVHTEQPISMYVVGAPRAFTSGGLEPVELLPLHWEYFGSRGWHELTVFDTSQSLTISGVIGFLTPLDMVALARFDLEPRFWIRALSDSNEPGDTQRIAGLYLNTVPAAQVESIHDEGLAPASGQPSQRLRLGRRPVLANQTVLVREPEPPPEHERAMIVAEEGCDAIQARVNPDTAETETWVRWHEVATFALSLPSSRHYTLERVHGVLTFGDGNQGLIPPRGSGTIVASYRTGGGVPGNVPAGAVSQVRTPLPPIASVSNPLPATGGAGAETIPSVEERGPQSLRHRGRAAARGDFEWLAREAAGNGIARVACLANMNRAFRFEPGWVTLVIVPRDASAKPVPSAEVVRQISEFLVERSHVALTGLRPPRINIVGPAYLRITVTARVVALDVQESEAVKARVLDALERFLHPLRGGPGGEGWELGRHVYASEVAKVLEDVEGVSHVKNLTLSCSALQHRLLLTSTLSRTLPSGSRVATDRNAKSGLLAEPVGGAAGLPGNTLAVRTFAEGDRIAHALDMTVLGGQGGNLDVGSMTVPGPLVGSVGFPLGSRIVTADGSHSARLIIGLLAGGGINRVATSDPAFASYAPAGSVVTVFHPFPLTVRAVLDDQAQTVEVDPYPADVVFDAGSMFATLDNSVRLPLAAAAPAQAPAPLRELRFAPFSRNESVTVTPPAASHLSPAGPARVNAVEAFRDIAYLDRQALAYSGPHRVYMEPE